MILMITHINLDISKGWCEAVARNKKINLFEFVCYLQRELKVLLFNINNAWFLHTSKISSAHTDNKNPTENAQKTPIGIVNVEYVCFNFLIHNSFFKNVS